MKTHFCKLLVPVVALAASIAVSFSAAAQTDPLPSWNDGANKQAIVSFVEAVTKESGADYVAPGDRIATFDYDGTLWVEHPIYTQLSFAFGRVKALAPQHPEWKTTQPFQAVLDGDMEALGKSGMKGLMVQYTTAGSGKRLGVFIHHDDADREYAYDRQTHVGTLDKALDDASKEGWHIISMKNDWKRIFPQ